MKHWSGGGGGVQMKFIILYPKKSLPQKLATPKIPDCFCNYPKTYLSQSFCTFNYIQELFHVGSHHTLSDHEL